MDQCTQTYAYLIKKQVKILTCFVYYLTLQKKHYKMIKIKFFGGKYGKTTKDSINA